MAKHMSTSAELRAMSAADLRKEIQVVSEAVAKQGLAVQSRTEKDTASFSRNKKQVARMLTVLREIELGKELNTKSKVAKVPASAKTSAGKPASSIS